MPILVVLSQIEKKINFKRIQKEKKYPILRNKEPSQLNLMINMDNSKKKAITMQI